jgi:hypothetical protein
MPGSAPGQYSADCFRSLTEGRSDARHQGFPSGEQNLLQTVEQLELPVFSLQLEASECRFETVDEIVGYLKQKIESHKAASYIATFDHLEHTRRLPEGQVAEGIVAAINLVFCLGFTLQEPSQLATRPRSIGICQHQEGFTVSFVEAPMPVINALMEEWALSLAGGPSARVL